MQRGHGLLGDTFRKQLFVDRFDSYLFEFVDRHGDVGHLVGVTDGLGDAVQDLAVVHLQRDPDAEFFEHGRHDFDQLDFVEQAAAADDIDVALEKLAVASLLRPVGAPYRLDLVAPERERDFVLVLYDVAGERYGEVVTQSFFAHFHRQRVAVGVGILQRFGCDSAQEVPRIQDFKEQLVALVAVFSEQRREVFHRRRFERQESVGAEDAFYRVENVGAFNHLVRAEIACALRNGWFLCHDGVFSKILFRWVIWRSSSTCGRMRSMSAGAIVYFGS